MTTARPLSVRLGGLALSLTIAGLASTVAAQPSFHILDIGLTDAEHTQADNARFSEVQGMNAAGHVYGLSEQAHGQAAFAGRSAWVFDGTQTIRIGPTDADHSYDAGFQWNDALGINEAGHVYGIAQRWDGNNMLGVGYWVYDGNDTVMIGFDDPEHVRADGWRGGNVLQMTEAGQVRGHMTRYNGLASSMGRTAWLYDGSDTVNVGLTDAGHTRDDGYRQSESFGLNEAGQVYGYAMRYDGPNHMGESAWLYDGAQSVRLGYTDAGHTRNDGAQWSYAYQLTDSGLVRGDSQRYDGADYMGLSAWVYDGSNHIDVSLTDAEHTRADGFRWSTTYGMTEAGLVRGDSSRYDGGAWMGQSVWVYDLGSDARTMLGLTDAEHTRADGLRESNTWQINAAGQVRGRSDRFSGSQNMGATAWFYDGSDTVVVGLTDAAHTRDDGYRNSVASRLTESGYVAGHSTLYNGTSGQVGTSHWVYDGNDTVRLGFVDAMHTSATGGHFGFLTELNEAGHITGHTIRYGGGAAALGQSHYHYDINTGVQTQIGLFGPDHTRDDGYMISHFMDMNDAGQIIGFSNRYFGTSSFMGQDAWLYDPATGDTTAIVLSTNSAGFAWSTPGILTDDGTVLGIYRLYDEHDDFVQRVFYHSNEHGTHDLGELVADGLDAHGWDHLFQAMFANSAAQITGHGIGVGLAPHSRSAYYLVPEPSSVALFGLAGLMLLRRRRREV